MRCIRNVLLPVLVLRPDLQVLRGGEGIEGARDGETPGNARGGAVTKNYREAALICSIAASSRQWAGDIRYIDIADDLGGVSRRSVTIARAALRTVRDHYGGRSHAQAEAVIRCGQICPECLRSVES